MIPLLVGYIVSAVVWFVFLTYCLGEGYEFSVFVAVFHPVIIALVYLALTTFLIVTPICEIIKKIIKRKDEN